ncbi:hypothetical protein ACF08N_01585 [Streptomyces sp. NPDC015127]|uniref:pPIWI_RE_Z domain-containing protein n=1 Tax=Streptomyces sp. NPDC015127 TaxID=3364939 RepID=UPI0036FA559B
MRDRSAWYQDLARELRPWPKTHTTARPALLCQVELALRLLEQLDPLRTPDGVWTLLGGYPFADAAGLATGPKERLALTAARHLLWPMRRHRMWEQCLEAYSELPEQLRGYRLVEGAAARRVDPPVAAHRFTVYDTALGRLPEFAAKPLPQAEAGSYRFMDHRRPTSVSITADLLHDRAAGHDVTAVRTSDPGPLHVPLSELADVARWMDDQERHRRLKAGNWETRLSDLDLDTRTADGAAFAPGKSLPLDGLTHLVGMVGAGKSTLMQLIAVWAHQRGQRTTLVVGDVAEQLALVEGFRSLGLSAALVQGGTTREQHTQRLHRRLAGRANHHSLLQHTEGTFAHLSTACPLDALRHLETTAPLRYADAPCGTLHPVRVPPTPSDRAKPQDLAELLETLGRDSAAAPTEPDEVAGMRHPHACPLWSVCPRHFAARSLVDALIWVANPASLVQTAVPRQLNAERLRYLELACLRSDIVIVDEADRVQMQLDRMFAPSATLIQRGSESWLDRLQTHAIEELARQGRLPLSDRDVARWSASLDVVGQAADRLLARLIDDPELREWAQTDYFSAWTLQERLLHEWFPAPARSHDMVEDEDELFDDDERVGETVHGDDAERSDTPYLGRRAEVTKLLDTYRDDPLGDRGPYDSTTDALTRLAHDLLHTLNEKGTRARARAVLGTLLEGAPGANERPQPRARRRGQPTRPADVPLSEAWLDRAAMRLEFTLILAVLHQRLDRVTFLWPQVEAALRLDSGGNELMRRPPLDYAPLVPEAPMGNVLGFQYLPDEQETPDPEGRRSGTLRFFRCAGVGRELLLSLPKLGARPEIGSAGPHVLLMSGTSWAGTSTRAHVLAPVRAVLKPNPRALRAVRDSVFSHCFLHDDAGRPLRHSGQSLDTRDDVLRAMVLKLARDGRGGEAGPLKRELNRITDDRRRRALLLVGSYREADLAAGLLNEVPRWRGRVRVLISDDTQLDTRDTEREGAAPASAIRRGDLASFAEDEDAELLVAPLMAIERGHNILTVPQVPGEDRVAAFGTVFFLARPHPRPDDLSLAVFAVNDWASRFVRNMADSASGTFSDLVAKASGLDEAGQQFRTVARGVWRRLLSRPYIYSVLTEQEKESFAWDHLVTIWQVIGRLVRGGVPARVVFVDAAFAPALAAAGAPDPQPDRHHDPGLLVRLRDVLAPYLDDRPPTSRFADPGDAALVNLLYRPLYEALCDLRPL